LPRRAVAVGAVVAGLFATGVAAPAQGATMKGLHDARYCEIIGLKGLPPNATASVWNTIGFNDCPADWWNAFDAGALAKELGDTVVVLNGPRHFLMDSVTVGDTGSVHTVHGQKLREVATIKIKTAADIVQTPYVDRVITRDNTWTWKKGTTVFELTAPGGDVYVMQSYSQIKDPNLRLAQLKGLGRRLDLPDGWRYRSRKLKKPLALSANGGATITQDELQNTYQLETAARPAHRKRKRRALDMTGKTKAVAGGAAGQVEDRGTVTGTPFGRGTIDLKGTLANGKLDATFRMTFKNGSVIGTVQMPFTISDGTITFDGHSKVIGGTGAFRGITGSALKTHDTNSLDGQSGRLAVSGSVSY
jgi:hypothetical protein